MNEDDTVSRDNPYRPGEAVVDGSPGREPEGDGRAILEVGGAGPERVTSSRVLRNLRELAAIAFGAYGMVWLCIEVAEHGLSVAADTWRFALFGPATSAFYWATTVVSGLAYAAQVSLYRPLRERAVGNDREFRLVRTLRRAASVFPSVLATWVPVAFGAALLGTTTVGLALETGAGAVVRAGIVLVGLVAMALVAPALYVVAAVADGVWEGVRTGLRVASAHPVAVIAVVGAVFGIEQAATLLTLGAMRAGLPVGVLSIGFEALAGFAAWLSFAAVMVTIEEVEGGLDTGIR